MGKMIKKDLSGLTLAVLLDELIGVSRHSGSANAASYSSMFVEEDRKDSETLAQYAEEIKTFILENFSQRT